MRKKKNKNKIKTEIKHWTVKSTISVSKFCVK